MYKTLKKLKIKLNNIHPNIYYNFKVFQKKKLNYNDGKAGGGGGTGWSFLGQYDQKGGAHLLPICDLMSMTSWQSCS
jgi:hypothetical protein